MGITAVKGSPRGLTWKVEIDSRGLDEGEFTAWLNGVKGQVYLMKTRFADKTSPKHAVHNRKRNFTDGYLLYTIWFAKKSDAALCRMMWELCRDDS